MTKSEHQQRAETTPDFISNRNLFSNHYLVDHLPDTDVWQSVDEAELERVYEDVAALYDRRRDAVEGYNESMLEQRFIRPVFDALGIDYGVEETVKNSRRRPDYGFFESDEAVDRAFDRADDVGDFYRDTIGVADAKQWGRSLDTQGEGKYTFENPSHQISVYLDETPAEWAVLTNGQQWRIYYATTAHRLDSYFEVDLPQVLAECDPNAEGGLEPFKYFLLFFRREAFLDDGTGCFLDRVKHESNIFAEELGEDLKDNIYDAIQQMAEGFLTFPGNDLDAGDLDRIHDASLIYLYRLIFVLYAESEGRDLLDTGNAYYSDRFSLNTLKTEVALNIDDSSAYPAWDDDLWHQLNDLFELIDKGSEAKGIPADDLHVPAYNGGLFRTDPNADDSAEAHFLQEYKVGDEHLAEVIILLTRSNAGNGDGNTFVDYSSLDIRHLGSIYEGLLEYELNIADEPLAVENGEYVPADGSGLVVEEGDVYLTTDSGERKTSGSYYTPDYVVEYIIETTIDPLLMDIRDELLGEHDQFAEEFADRVFDLKILDPASGSGHFLTEAVDYLAREIIDAQQKQAEQQDDPDIDESHDIYWARRQIAQKCIYGVDLNPLAVELSKVSLWLRTLAAEQPLAFLDHHLKTGNSLIGSDIESIEGLESSAGEDSGPNAPLTRFGMTRQGTIEQLMGLYQEFIAIENESRADTKTMERKYREIERDVMRNRLVAMANVHTAEGFDVDVPGGAYERMAGAVNDDEEWARIAEAGWFEDAQALAERHAFHHWRLEFPEVFYDADGDLKESPGFDVVGGNPPYVRIQRIDDAVADWLFDEYVTCSKKVDISVPFLELAVDLISEAGVAGYISTSQWLSTDYGRAAREFLGEGHVRRLVDLGTLPVFEGISTYPAIFILDKAEREVLEYGEVTSKAQLNLDALRGLDLREFGYERFGSESWVLEGLDLRGVLEDAEGTEPLAQWGDWNIGAITGMDEVFVVNEMLIEERGLERELIYPHAHRAGEISRFGVVKTDERVIYPYEGGADGGAVLIPEHRLEDDYPNIHAYLQESEDELRERRDSRKYYADNSQWYQFLRQGRYDYIGVDKLLARGVATEACVGLLEAESIFSGNNCPGFVPADDIPGEVEFLLGLLNSMVVSEYLQQVCPEKLQGYIRLNAGDLNSVPVPEVSFDASEDRREELVERGMKLRDAFVAEQAEREAFARFVEEQLSEGRSGVVHDVVAGLAGEMTELVAEHKSINLNLADYLGNYESGQAFADLPGSQPAAGVSETLLVETTEEYPKLRLDDLVVKRDGDAVTVGACVRYKPDDPGELDGDKWEEPDQHGYVRSQDVKEAIEVRGVSDEMATLIEEFVELVNERDDGFAEFREQARKRITLKERIEALELPALDDVEDGLERYLQAKERAMRLDEELSTTEDLIDCAVFQLYGLDDWQVEIVREAADD